MKLYSLGLIFLLQNVLCAALGSERVISVAAQSNGKLIALSQNVGSNSVTFDLFRLNTDGSLDKTFASNGSYSFLNGVVVCPNIIIESTDSIVVGYNTSGNAYLQRFDQTGALSGSPAQIWVSNSSVKSLCLYASGAIGAVGLIGINGILQGIISRFTSAFAPDTTFNGGDPQYVQNGSQAEAQVCAIDSSGNLVVAGQVSYGSAFLARYTPTGAVDNTFGSSGIQAISATQITCIGFDSLSRILICGSNSGQAFIQRLTSSGSVDGTFTPSISISSAFDNPTNFAGLKVSMSDSVLVCGSSLQNDIGQLITVKYTSTGSLDTTFNATGYALTQSPFGIAAQGLFVYGAGSMISYGSARGGSLFAKYLSTGLLDTTFGAGGYLYLAPEIVAQGFISNDNGATQQDITSASNTPVQFARQNASQRWSSNTVGPATTFACGADGYYLIIYSANIGPGASLLGLTVPILYNFQAILNPGSANTVIRGSATGIQALASINVSPLNAVQTFTVGASCISKFSTSDTVQIQATALTVPAAKIYLTNATISIMQVE